MMLKVSNDEIIRRRAISIKNLEAIDREQWLDDYQKWCDRKYWSEGQCCAGCDFWESSGGHHGKCKKSAIVSGAEVMRSMGIDWCSKPQIFTADHVHTKAGDWCGQFRDNFDWSTLDDDYLAEIGASLFGKLCKKPTRRFRD